MNKQFSVIIPLYNKGPYISRAVESVLHQTVQNFEIIVVDDHSGDRGPEIVKTYHDPRITLIEQEHRGVSFTRNHGVDLATCDYIAFLDADDEWMPIHLETITRLIQMYPSAGMYSTSFKRQNADGTTQWASYNSIPPPPFEGLVPDYFRTGSRGDFAVSSSTVVIPKKIFHEMGGFPEGCMWGEDVDLFSKIALKYPVAFSREFGAIYHLDDTGRASTRMPPVDYQEPFIKTARTALMKGEVPQEARESLNEYIWKIESRRAVYNLRAGHPETAQRILKQCTPNWRYNENVKWLLLATLPTPLYLYIRDMRRKLIRMVRKKH